MGLNLANMTKIVKCAGNDDAITVKTGDKSDTVSFIFEVFGGGGGGGWGRGGVKRQCVLSFYPAPESPI